mmetsp:Transcript_117133/g.268939  ORF Transcript_117133/g.268939 Transcript_117133/m.268939 type:complete len:203 (+) Transcript_117133:924-1532(+)
MKPQSPQARCSRPPRSASPSSSSPRPAQPLTRHAPSSASWTPTWPPGGGRPCRPSMRERAASVADGSRPTRPACGRRPRTSYCFTSGRRRSARKTTICLLDICLWRRRGFRLPRHWKKPIGPTPSRIPQAEGIRTSMLLWRIWPKPARRSRRSGQPRAPARLPRRLLPSSSCTGVSSRTRSSPSRPSRTRSRRASPPRSRLY